MSYRWQVTVQGRQWTIKTPSNSIFSWPPLLAIATTLGSETVFDQTYAPDAQSLAHEFYHVIHTNDFHYFFSWSVGRLWNDQYWRNEERNADAYGIAHKNDPEFVAVAAQIRKDLPPSSKTATFTHPV